VELLLDTQTILFWLGDDDRLGPRARALIADPANDVLVTVASFREIVVKARIGKLEADIGEILDATERDGFLRLGTEPPHLAALASPPAHHRDPFDHLLVAQAIAESATFVSADTNASKYPVDLLTCSGRTRRRL
jgi:PIN domain nuclease of toxin-antitoxin system